MSGGLRVIAGPGVSGGRGQEADGQCRENGDDASGDRGVGTHGFSLAIAAIMAGFTGG
nr:hypothetical protein GCM10020093_035380 [Planobispora longispora]